MTRKRSAARTEFLTDILTIAIEGGVNYWATILEYKHSDPEPYAVLVDSEDLVQDDNWDWVPSEGTEPYRVDLDVIARGVNRIVNATKKPVPFLTEAKRKVVTAASMQNDCMPDMSLTDNNRSNLGHYVSDIDADVADDILQVGIFGEVRYG